MESWTLAATGTGENWLLLSKQEASVAFSAGLAKGDLYLSIPLDSPAFCGCKICLPPLHEPSSEGMVHT